MHMLIRYVLVSFLFLIGLIQSPTLSAQMVVGQDTLYGNEWIDYSKTYWKIKVAERDMYRVTFDVLQAGGFPVDQVPGDQFQLFVFGEEVPLYVSTDGLFGPSDYFEFYGDKNKSQLDQFLFEGGRDAMLNPEVSLYTDTSVYFLTFTETGQSTLRYTEDEQDLTGAPAALQYISDTSRIDFFEEHYSQTYDFDRYVKYSLFDLHEGFTSAYAKNITFYLESDGIVQDDLATLYIKLISGPTLHNLQIKVNDIEIGNYPDYPINKIDIIEIPISTNLLSSYNKVQIIGLVNNSDRYQISWATLSYPKSVKPSSQNHRVIIDNLNGSQHLKWQDPSTWIAFDPIHLNRQELLSLNDTVHYYFKNNLSGTTFIAYHSSFPRLVNQIVPISPIPYTNLHADFIIIFNPNVIHLNPTDDPLSAYAAYRASKEGGSHKVAILDINQLYYQFAYGNANHPLALRNWASHTLKTNQPIENCLLVGKGIDYSYLRRFKEFQSISSIPTFGTPGSDNLLVALPMNSNAIFSVGRIPAITTNEINQYLDKLIAYEASSQLPRTINNYHWRHKGIHLNGGYHQLEIDLFRTLLDDMALTIQQGHLGIEVTNLTSNSNDAISKSNLSVLYKLLNEGAILKTYLGHGSPSTTSSFSIDDPSVLKNNIFLPLAFSLGCYTGNAFTSSKSLSEKFVLEGKKGSIGYIASSGLGFPSALYNMTSEFYHLQSDACFGCSVGETLNHVRKYFNNEPGYSIVSLRDQLNYYGDPAIILAVDTLPDFIPSASSLKLLPSSPKVNSDSLVLQVDIINIGRQISTPLIIESRVTFPDGTVIVKLDTLFLNSFSTPFSLTLFPNSKFIPGEYKFFIRLDPFNRIKEVINGGEDNNTLDLPNNISYYSFFIQNNTPVPAYPSNYAIVYNDQLELIGFSPQDGRQREFTLELDTTPLFSSPDLIQSKIITQDALLRWQPKLTSNQVYFWRIIYTDKGEPLITSSTFSFLTSDNIHTGWNQSTFYQFTDNYFSGLISDTLNRQFIPSSLPINIKAHALASDPIINIYRSTVDIDDKQAVFYSKNPSLSIFILDHLNATPLTSHSFLMSGSNHQRKEAIQFLCDSLSIGDVCIVLTYHNKGQSFGCPDWASDSLTYGANISSVLETFGATKIREFQNQDGAPYAFAFKPGSGSIQEALAAANDNNAFITFDLPIPEIFGQMSSPIIGPSNQWDSLFYQLKALSDSNNDLIRVSLWGVSNPAEQPTLLYDSLNVTEILTDPLINTFPFLQLSFSSKDSIQRTAAQLAQWRIYAKPGPDLVPEFLSDHAMVYEQGEPGSLQYKIYNLGEEITDSIHIDLSIITPKNELILSTNTLTALPKDTFVSIQVSLPNSLQAGDYQMILEIDKTNRIHERIESNNTTFYSYTVLEDKQAPILDVRFDETIIVNQATVSQSPNIRIRLWDDNAYLPLSDTTLLSISLISPSGYTLPFYYSDNSIQFSLKNSQTIEAILQPFLSEDGYYQLIVSANDASGNISSDLPYTVMFHTIRENTLISFTPVPNPADQYVRFAIHYEGPSTPARCQLQIFTADGKQVLSVSEKEFGQIAIGQSTSEYLWDCSDNGDHPVPSGTYYYQVKFFDQTGALIPYTGNGSTSRNDFISGSIVVIRQ